MIPRVVLLLSVSLFPATTWAQQEGVLHKVEINAFRPVHQPLSEKSVSTPEGPERL
jgi:hypothetical protein